MLLSDNLFKCITITDVALNQGLVHFDIFWSLFVPTAPDDLKGFR